ncbi:MAG: DUF3656 domain-containing protein, partial [Clostridia bacterium]|nr:DUF3656 domain-containing protein [Clostridia bacterium]
VFSENVIKRCQPGANFKKIGIDAYVSFKKNRPMELTLIDTDFNTVTVESDLASETAMNRPLDYERIKEQMKKLGNTPFEIVKIEVDSDEGITIPISEINALRRKAVSELETLRCEVPKRRNLTGEDREYPPCSEKLFSAEVRTYEQAKAVAELGIEVIYAPGDVARKIKNEFPDRRLITVLSPVWKENKKYDCYVADGVLASNVGELEHFKDFRAYGGLRLNVCNNKSIENLSDLRILTVSPELNLREIRKLHPYTMLEGIVYGRLPLMVMENCPKKAHGKCGKDVILRDRMKEEFPLVCSEGCYCELLNSKPLYMADKFDELLKTPLNVYKLMFTTEKPEECARITLDYQRAMAGEKVSGMKENTFTRGHYYRGVE